MNIKKVCSDVLQQLSEVLDQLRDEDFRQPIELLSGASIGQHVRHTLEFFLCLKEGLEKGVVNYDQRTRDIRIEEDKQFALLTIGEILDWLINQDEQKDTLLEVDYAEEKSVVHTIPTNSQRELCYNIEHAVHHMALIKIGVRNVAPYLNLPKEFGVAVSTIRHQNILGQEA
jgi:hypothetical protein